MIPSEDKVKILAVLLWIYNKKIALVYTMTTLGLF